MGTLGSYYGIARQDQASSGTYGWQVRLQRAGVRYARYFPDRTYGGPRESLAEAIRWRDDLLQSLAQVTVNRSFETCVRNSSGVVGVSRVAVRSNQGVEYFFWQASWTPVNGVRQTVRFSVKRHGEEVAFQLAVEARRAATGG